MKAPTYRITFSTLLMVWVVTLLGACSKPEPADPARPYVGTWRVDVKASLEADPKVQSLPQSGRQSVAVVVKAFLDEMTMEFKANGRFLIANGQYSASMPYTIEEKQPDGGVKVRLTDPTLPETDPRQTLDIKYQAKRMRVSRGDQVFILQRAND